ncbi:MAG: hypothetical protein ACF8PN_05175 [Phycisphaerales bacterium]
MDLTLTILCAIGFAGVALIVRGWKHRVVDGGRYCRACDYRVDLSASVVCPECGAGLERPGAVSKGRREPRRGAMLAGCALTLMAATALGVRYLPDWRTVNLYPYYPAWYLLRADFSAEAGYADEAVLELRRRVALGDLADDKLDRFAEMLTLRATALNEDHRGAGFQPFTGSTLEMLRTRKPPDAILDPLLDAVVERLQANLIHGNVALIAPGGRVSPVRAVLIEFVDVPFTPYRYTFDSGHAYPTMWLQTEFLSASVNGAPITPIQVQRESRGATTVLLAVDERRTPIAIDVRYNWIMDRTDPTQRAMPTMAGVVDPFGGSLTSPDLAIKDEKVELWHTQTRTLLIEPPAEISRLNRLLMTTDRETGETTVIIPNPAGGG